MSTIRIQSSSRTWGSPTARVFRIGRDPASDVVTDNASVSRAHAELRPVGDGWEVVDLDSSLGTWVNGHRVQRADLTGTTVIGFGDPTQGFSLTVTVSAPTRSPLPPPPPTGPPVGLDTTMISGPLFPPGGGPGDPGGPGGPGATGTPAGPAEPPGLLVRRRLDSDVRFGGHGPVRVGRDPQMEVVADDSAVSRLHAVIEPGPDGWRWTDHSTGGSYVDGERISTLLIEEPTEISLGHPNAGYEIEVVPVLAVGQAVAAMARQKRQRALVIGGAALAVVLAVVGAVALGAAVTGDDRAPAAGGGLGQDTLDDRLDSAELDRAKAASVFLTAIDDSGNPLYTGSGSIISSDGLILTNAHVGKPTAPGQGAIEGGDPAFLLVSVTSGSDDVAAEPTYRAESIVADGYLDLAVLQITADAAGNPVDSDDLDLPEPLPLGSSSDVRTGDEITALGYPAIGNVASQLSKPLTITRGVVSTFQSDPVIGTERGFIDSDVRLGSGNSGGPSINDAGEIIGINTAVITANSDSAGAITSGSALIRPVDLASDLLRIARSGGDPDYVSPYVDTLPRSDVMPDNVSFESAGWVTDGDEGGCNGVSTIAAPQQMAVVPGELIYAEYLIRGVPDGTPIGVTLYSLDGTEVLGSLQDIWSFGPDRTCIYVPFEAPGGVAGVNGVFVVGEQAEAVVDNPLTYQ
ncbi:FHA domain-containing protein [Nocardioides sp.]|uniref:FHA domain-containing protein n=1 Tax=Nocardioides sp. TaxID=35761 RepID=UPI002B27BD08|nr:FHA domain-containing protein [Nocardioides sp.]